MCGRVVQASDPLRYALVDGLSVPDNRTRPPSYNVAPSQLLYVIRENHETGERTLDLLRWGLIPRMHNTPMAAASRSTRGPSWCRACRASARPMQSVGASCLFDCFFEWRAIKGERAKHPYAVATRDRAPFGIAGLWENRRHPPNGEWISHLRHHHRVPANELVSQIHDRMPLILPRALTSGGWA